jgi:hypothetical protein
MIFELVMACASRPKVIANVNVFKNYVLVERGPLAIDPETFDLAKSFGPRPRRCFRTRAGRTLATRAEPEE